MRQWQPLSWLKTGRGPHSSPRTRSCVVILAEISSVLLIVLTDLLPLLNRGNITEFSKTNKTFCLSLLFPRFPRFPWFSYRGNTREELRDEKTKQDSTTKFLIPVSPSPSLPVWCCKTLRSKCSIHVCFVDVTIICLRFSRHIYISRHVSRKRFALSKNKRAPKRSQKKKNLYSDKVNSHSLTNSSFWLQLETPFSKFDFHQNLLTPSPIAQQGM